MPNTPYVGLIEGFLHAADNHPDMPALFVDNQTHTYSQLFHAARRIQTKLEELDPTTPLAAVFASRSLAAYAGVIAVLLSGKGYTPLNKSFPARRSRTMLALSGCRAVIVGEESLPALAEALREDSPDTPALAESSLFFIVPFLDDPDQAARLRRDFAAHHWIFADDLPDDVAGVHTPAVDPDAAAYLLFTSGSTGTPKGVPVSHANARAYVDHVSARYQPGPGDRLSQTFDMTFDLSVHDMFVAWSNGACLYAIPETSVMAPGKFIKDHALTMWFSVPSAAMFMARLRMLKPAAFPSLRVSLFCGEPLPVASAEKWQAAAPDSILENLYGPTEATIAITHYRWNPEESPAACRHGLVPIGHVFSTQRGEILRPDETPAPPGEPGELVLAGSQVTAGYLNNPEKTAAQYRRFKALGERTWYLTGDLVERDADGCLYYLSRIDNQTKIRGHRVELAEIEHHLRLALDVEAVAATPWPMVDGSAEAVYGFVVAGQSFDEQAVIGELAESLPEYMTPRRVFSLETMPLNPNGKIDRRELTRMLENALKERQE